MKFLHTADWQIGSGATASTRQARLLAIEHVIRLASDHAVDFVLLAGDTFEHPEVEFSLLEETAAAMARFPCPLYLIPGNHDPGTPNGIWSRSLWRSVKNLHVLLTPEPVPVEGGTLLPCPLRDRYQSSNPTAWLATAPGDGYRIAIAHGNLQINIPDLEKSEPIFPNIVTTARLDYLALGHWHSTFLRPGEPRLAYSGTHETTRFGEANSGNVLLVEPGEMPRALRSGYLEWRSESLTLDTLAALAQWLEALPPPERTVLRLRLAGALTDAELLELPDLLSRYHWVDLKLDRQRLYSRSESVELPAGLLRSLAEDLTSLAATDPVAERALAHLRRYARELSA